MRKNGLIEWAVVLTVFWSTCHAMAGHPLEEWHWRNPLPQGQDLISVEFMAGRFIAVGTRGTMLQSTNGENWSIIQTPVTDNLCDITEGGGVMVAVGDHGTILSSNDGLTWTRQPSPTTNALYSVTFGNGKFVAVGYQTLLTSTDGRSWSAQPCLTNQLLQSVAYGNGTFVVVGGGMRLSSTDGLLWTTNSMDDLFEPGYLYVDNMMVTYAGGMFVGLAMRHTKWPWAGVAVSRSTDGRTWTSRGLNLSYPSADSVAYGNGVFVGLCGLYGDVTNLVTSPDGLNWTQPKANPPQYLHALAYGNGMFVGVGNYGTIATSPDGVVWTKRSVLLPQPPSSSWGSPRTMGFAARGDCRVAVGFGTMATGFILAATNGVDYSVSLQPSSPPGLNAVVCSDAGRFVAVGYGGTILSSEDGITWSNRTSPTANDLLGIGYGGGKFVAVGYSSTMTGNSASIIVSSSGTAWGLRPAVTTQRLRSVAYGNGTWVIVGKAGTVFSSPDTVTWDPQDASTMVELTAVGYGNGLFVAVGESGTIITSPDGVNWTVRNSGVSVELTAIRYGQGIWVATGPQGTMLVSYDGVTWTRKQAGTTFDLAGVGYDGGCFFLLGASSLILQSGQLNTPQFLEQRRSPSGIFEIYFTGQPGATYQFQAAPSLRSSSWTSLLSFTNTTGLTRLQDSSATTNPARFYRIAVP